MVADQEERLNNETILKLVRTSEALVKAGDRFFKLFGVTITQYDVLVILKYSDKKVTQGDLGNYRVVSRSNITGIIDRLEKLGYAKREASTRDRRVNYIKITPHGEDLIKKVERDYFNNVKKVVRFLTASDKKSLVEITGKIEKGLKELS